MRETDSAKKAKKASDSLPAVVPELHSTDAGPLPGGLVGDETESQGVAAAISSPLLGHSFSHLSIFTPQAKLTVGAPGDPFEKEADQVADQIVQMEPPADTNAGGTNLKSSSAASGRVLSSSGQPLDPETRAFMEPRFGHDFSRVRVHTESPATLSAKALNAKAYAVGNDVVFGAGQYSPGTSEGRRLLAHELTHVVQQTGGGAAGSNAGESSLQIQRSPLSIQRALHTLGGEWDTTSYTNVGDGTQDDGVKIDLKFSPQPPVDAKAISMVQMVNSIQAGTPLALNPTVAGRSIPNDKPGGGSHIDQFAGLNSPVYAANPSTPNAPSLAGTPIGAQWGKNGFLYTDSAGTVQKSDAQLKDTPRIPGRGANASQIFETTALAVDGTQTGTYYGSVKWGWQSDASGAFTKLPLSVISNGVPSATFMKAAELWNKGTTSSGAATLPLPVSGVTTGPDPKTLSTSQLAIRISEVVAEMGKLPPGPSTDRTNKEFEKTALETELASRADKPTISLEDHIKAVKALTTRRLLDRIPEIITEIAPLSGGDKTSKELEKYAAEMELKGRNLKVTVHVLSTSDILGDDEVYVKASQDGREHRTGVRSIGDHGVSDFLIPLGALLASPFPPKPQFTVQVWEEDVVVDDVMADIKWPPPYTRSKQLYHPESGTNYEVTVDFDA